MLSDPLTAVANRRGFGARLEEEIERHFRYQHSLCLAMGNIDHFKHINDTFGRNMGDSVI